MDTTPYLSIKSNANLVVLEDGAVRTIPLDCRTEWTIGRVAPGNEPDIVLNSKIASRHHGKLANINGQWFFVDNGSSNGTYYNGNKIVPGADGSIFPVALSNGDILRIDSNNLMTPDMRGVWMMFSTVSHGNMWYTVDLEKDETVVGRNEELCDVVVPLSFVSGRHFVVRRKQDNYYVMDCDSMAGTWLNNEKVSGEILLKEKDHICMCDCTFIFTGNSLIYNLPIRKRPQIANEQTSMNMQAVNVTPAANVTPTVNAAPTAQAAQQPTVAPTPAVVNAPAPNVTPMPNSSMSSQGATTGANVAYQSDNIYMDDRAVILKADIKNKVVPNNSGIGEKELIRDVKVEVKESSLVALLGGSGAGKSTVMNCLNGMETKGVTGTIEYQGVDLLKNFDRMKYLIGSVPQEQVFHPSLTVESELKHAAKRRLPGDTSGKEIKAHVDQAIEQLKLTNIRKNKISKCSGGEQKRVNIGIELVADRQLLCLDEPDAGLDPGTKKELFTILRHLAHDENKSILVIIHDVSDIDLFDQIIMMTKVDNVGRLAFSGSPQEARKYFGTDIKEAYALLAEHPEKYVKGL